MRTKLLNSIPSLIQITHIQGNAIATNKQNAQTSAYKMLSCPTHYVFDVPLTMHKSNWNKLRKILKTKKKIEECGKWKTKLSGKRRRIRKCKSGLATKYEVFIQEKQ